MKRCFLTGKALDDAVTSPCESLEGLETVVVCVDCGPDPAEAEGVSDDKSVADALLRQIGIGLLELLHLFWIEDEDFPFKPSERSILAEKTSKIVTINRGCLHTDVNGVHMLFLQYRDNTL